MGGELSVDAIRYRHQAETLASMAALLAQLQSLSEKTDCYLLAYLIEIAQQECAVQLEFKPKDG